MGKVLVKIPGSPHKIINLVTPHQSLWFAYTSSMIKEYPCHLLVLISNPSSQPTQILCGCVVSAICSETSKTNYSIVKIRAATKAAPYHSVSPVLIPEDGK